MTLATLAAINLYPVKSCRGVGLERARVTVRGLASLPAQPGARAVSDREWMVVDANGRFLTQREHPRLALVRIAIADDRLWLSASDRAPIAVALEAPDGPARNVVVWKDTVRASDAGEPIAAWLRDHLGANARLVHFDGGQQRLCNPAYAGNSGAHTAFADGYPVLVIGEASLEDLNAKLAATGTPALPMNRFRPNLVLRGLEAFDEDHVDTIALGAVTLRMVKPCTRCTITTTDQESARTGSEPLATLGAYRMNAAMGGVTFGMNAIVVSGERATIAVGDEARVSFRFDE